MKRPKLIKNFSGTTDEVFDILNNFNDENKKYIDYLEAKFNNVGLADVSHCNCNEIAKCDNCGDMATKISTGEICSSCYC